MKTITLLLISMFSILYAYSQSYSFDSNTTAGCGISPDEIARFMKGYQDYRKVKDDPEYEIKTPLVQYTAQENFPDTSIVRCGNFRIFYEDLLHSPKAGFADISHGSDRRNILCQVLQYVQSIIYIQSGDTLDLYVDQSWSNSNLPPAQYQNALAAASPYFSVGWGNVPGIYNGNMFNHIVSGIDPDTLNYDGILITNFIKDFIDDTTNQNTTNLYDLYSVLLHEITHTLGFLSGIKEGTTVDHYPTSNSNSFSRYDSLFLYYGSHNDIGNLTNLITFDINGNPSIDPTLATTQNCLRTNKIWLLNDTTSLNQPVYSGYYLNTGDANVLSPSLLSHLAIGKHSFISMSQYLPGFQPIYVMGPTMSNKGDYRRKWTIQELRILQNFGYIFKSNFLNSTNINLQDTNYILLQKVSPYRSNFRNKISEHCLIDLLFPDNSPPDTTIYNYNSNSNPDSTVYQLNITTCPLFTDKDNDIIRILPGTLFGIRGVDTIGNEHSQLEISQDSSTIIFKPYSDFSGRAQFGFSLYDGHEKGALIIYTIEVIDAINSQIYGKELVLNGTFEDGVEVRQWKNYYTLQKPYSNFYSNYDLPGEYCSGIHFSGGHPYTQLNGISMLTHSYNYIYSGGDYILMASHDNGSYSRYFTIDSCKFLPKFNVLPKTIGTLNERYHRLSYQYNFLTLTDSIKPCSELEFNLNLCYKDTSVNYFWEPSGFNIGDTLRIQLDFISDPSPNPDSIVIYQSVIISDIVDSLSSQCEVSIWNHISDTLNYCGNEAAKYIRLKNLNSLSYPYPQSFYNAFLFIDNLSLKLLPQQPLTLTMQTDTTQICLGQSLDIVAITGDTICPITYLWSPGNYTTQTINVSPTTSTTYFVTVSNGCSSVVDSISITVYPIPSAVASYDQPVCLDGLINLHANYGITGGSTYSWSGPNSFTSQLQDPILQNANTSMNGTYYLTVTSDYGCINIDSLDVLIDTTQHIQGNPSYFFGCPGDTLFLYSDSGLLYYIWWGPDNFGSTEQNPIITNVTPTNSGYYYLMVYNSSYCVDFDSVYVNTASNLGATLSTNTPICEHDTLKLYSDTADTYFWTGPNGFCALNQNPIILNSDDTLNTGWYICYLQDSSGCYYDSLHVEVLYCCTDSLVTLLSKSNISDYSGSLPMNIAIPGELNIDVNYTFYPGSNIIMLPKSSIRVWSGVNLGIDSSYIHGCTMLWNTINVEDFAGLVLTNSTVEDAEYAVTVNDKPSLNISNNHFHKNYVGLYVTEPSPWDNMRTLGSFTFSGNEFDCQGDVLLKPYTGQISNAGVWLHSELAVSLYGNTINSYHHMKNGILSYNTNLDVLNSKFYHISDSVGTGCGIYAEAYNHPFNLVQKGWGTTIDTTFRHCDIGINAFRMNTAISYNMMHKVKVGIYIMGSPYTYQYMTSNYLECSNYGIVAALNDPVMSMDITENIINMNSSNLSSPSVGIYLFEFRNPPVDFTKIHNNHILMDTCKFGIKLYNSSNSETYENYISMTKPFQNFHGISLEYCPNSFVSCNEVQGINDTLGQMGQLLPRGLNVKECYTSKFSCNSFSNSLVGANFENRCYDDSIRGNTFYNHHYGLHYNKYCITGPQKHQGNKWFGSYYIGAKHDYDTNYQYVYLNPYRMKFNPTFYVPPSFDPLVWITVTPDTTTYFCTTCPKMDTAGSFDSIFSPIDYAIANGLAATAEYQETSQWLSSRFLYNKLLYDTLLVMADSIMQNFYDSIQYVSPGVFQWADLKGKEALHLDQVSKSLVDTLSKQISATLDLIVLTDSLLRTSVSMNDSLELLIEKEMLVSLLENLNSQLAAVMQGLKNVQLTKINTVISQNQILPTTQVYEQNEHVINDIYLNTIAKGIFSFTSNQVAAIASIAIQCPLAGGNAVYQARSLYALVHDTLYDDQLLCYLAGIKQQQIPKDKSTKDVVFRLYPNPTVNSVNIEWKDTKDEKAIIEVVTPLGQLYYQSTFSLSSGSLVVNTTSWRPGVYQVCITYLSKKIYCDKLIIVD